MEVGLFKQDLVGSFLSFHNCTDLTAVGQLVIRCYVETFFLTVVHVPDPGKGVCTDPVNRGAILEGEGPGPPSGDKESQLSPDKGRGDGRRSRETTPSWLQDASMHRVSSRAFVAQEESV